MSEPIYVYPNATSANVISVSGVCYQRVGPSDQSATVTSDDIQGEFTECNCSFYQARICCGGSLGDLAGLWLPASSISSFPYTIFQNSTCYTFLSTDAPSTTPGTLAADYTVEEGENPCSDSTDCTGDVTLPSAVLVTMFGPDCNGCWGPDWNNLGGGVSVNRSGGGFEASFGLGGYFNIQPNEDGCGWAMDMQSGCVMDPYGDIDPGTIYFQFPPSRDPRGKYYPVLPAPGLEPYCGDMTGSYFEVS